MLKNVLATVAFNTGIAIVVAALLIWFGGLHTSSSMLEMFLGSMIYSQLVGTTTSLTMEWLLPKLAQKRIDAANAKLAEKERQMKALVCIRFMCCVI